MNPLMKVFLVIPVTAVYTRDCVSIDGRCTSNKIGAVNTIMLVLFGVYSAMLIKKRYINLKSNCYDPTHVPSCALNM